MITKEMLDWFIERTGRHIELVRKYCQKIFEYDSVRFSDILDRGEEHDKSKWNEPELTPYILITWQYYCKDNDIDFEVDDVMKQEMNTATEHHILGNSHHPEYCCDRKDNLINKDDRDGNIIPDKIIDATKMKDIDIAEMVADWCGMSEEKNGSPIEWAEKVIGTRWKLNDYQIDLIYELIDKIWGDIILSTILEQYLKSSLSWKKFLNNIKEESVPKEIVLKFGKILFGDFRNKNEKDTEYEKRVFEIIKGWIKGDFMGKQPKREIGTIINELKKLKQYYPDVLVPNTNILYRLIVVKIKDMSSMISDLEKIGSKWYTKKEYTYIPENIIQSWTTSEGVGLGFLKKSVGVAMQYTSQNLYTRILIKAKFQDDEMLFNSKFLNAVALDEIGMRQNEVLHIGRNPIKVQYILNDYIYSRLLDGMNLRRKFIKYKDIEGIIFDREQGEELVLLSTGKIIKIEKIEKKIKNDIIKFIPSVDNKTLQFFKKYFKEHPDLYFVL